MSNPIPDFDQNDDSEDENSNIVRARNPPNTTNINKSNSNGNIETPQMQTPSSSTIKKELNDEKKDSSNSKGKVTYLISSQESRKNSTIIFWVLISLLAILLAIIIISIYFLAVQAPQNLGAYVCCSPKDIRLGQYLQSGNYVFQFFENGNLALQVQSPTDPRVYNIVWETNTANNNVSYAQLTTSGTLVLINTTGNRIWSTAPSADPAIGPFTLMLTSDGHVLIKSSTNLVVYDHPPESLGPTNPIPKQEALNIKTETEKETEKKQQIQKDELKTI